MAHDGDDPSRWSHSTGEAREFEKRIAAFNSGRSSEYSGVPEEGGFGVPVNPTDAAVAISSGQAAQERKKKAREEREIAEIQRKLEEQKKEDEQKKEEEQKSEPMERGERQIEESQS
jgi:acetoin utilization deacetylase AcuC-like enzyme